MSFFISPRSLLGSILSSQTDPPTLKNDDFMKAGARFLQIHHFPFKDGFGSVLGSMGVILGILGALLGASWGLLRGPRLRHHLALEQSGLFFSLLVCFFPCFFFRFL